MRSIKPHNEAGYTSAVVTLNQSLPKSVAIGRGPYTSRHDRYLRIPAGDRSRRIAVAYCVVRARLKSSPIPFAGLTGSGLVVRPRSACDISLSADMSASISSISIVGW